MRHSFELRMTVHSGWTVPELSLECKTHRSSLFTTPVRNQGRHHERTKCKVAEILVKRFLSNSAPQSTKSRETPRKFFCFFAIPHRDLKIENQDTFFHIPIDENCSKRWGFPRPVKANSVPPTIGESVPRKVAIRNE